MFWFPLVLCVAPMVCQESAQSDDPDEPAREEAPSNAQGPTLEGQATVGLRLIRVDGSHEQYDEDVNLSEGLFLHGFELREQGLAGLPLDSLALHAEGIGDPFSNYRLDSRAGPWRAIARYDKSQYVGNAQADQHPFDIARQNGSLDFEYGEKGSRTRSSFGLDTFHRDGFYLGSRSSGFESVSGFPLRREEGGTGMRGAFATDAAGWSLDLDLGLRKLQTDDRLSFAQPSPSFPDSTLTEDFRGTADGTSDSGRLRLKRELGASGARLDLSLDWQVDDSVGDFTSQETGFLFDPSLPFARDTQGDLSLARRRTSGSAGIVWPVSDDAEVELRFERELEHQDGTLSSTIVLDELTGDPPTIFEFDDDSRESSALDLFSLGLNSRLSERTTLDLALDWGSEDLSVNQVVEDVTLRSFDGTLQQFGGKGKLALDAGEGWSLDLSAGHERMPAATAEGGSAFDFLDEHTSFGRLSCRWRGRRSSVEGSAKFEHRQSDALTSTGDYGTYGVSYAGEVGERVNLDLGLAVQTYDLESDAILTVFVPGSGLFPVPIVAGFGGHQVMVDGSLELELGALRPNASWSAAFSSGSTQYTYETARLSLPWSLAPAFAVGIETAYLNFDGDGPLDPSDYDALIIELFVRQSFGANAHAEM